MTKTDTSLQYHDTDGAITQYSLQILILGGMHNEVVTLSANVIPIFFTTPSLPITHSPTLVKPVKNLMKMLIDDWIRGRLMRTSSHYQIKGGMHNDDVRTSRLERNPDFDHRAMLLNAQISGNLVATLKLTYDFVVYTAPRVIRNIKQEIHLSYTFQLLRDSQTDYRSFQSYYYFKNTEVLVDFPADDRGWN